MALLLLDLVLDFFVVLAAVCVVAFLAVFVLVVVRLAVLLVVVLFVRVAEVFAAVVVRVGVLLAMATRLLLILVVTVRVGVAGTAERWLLFNCWVLFELLNALAANGAATMAAVNGATIFISSCVNSVLLFQLLGVALLC